MPAVQRWTLHDPVLHETYEFPLNPRSMGSIHRPRNITARTTTAVDGQSLVTEGNAPPHTWTFEGAILTPEHYADLLTWSQKPYRVTLTDHFGRSFDVVLQNFDTTPKRAVGRYWRHEYTMTGLIVSTPTAPTVGV